MEDWKISEALTKRNFQGEFTPGSGSGSQKLDIIAGGPFTGLRVENKFTKFRSRSIKLDELLKAFKQAMQHFNEYIILLDFQLKNRYVICSETYFIRIHEELEEHRQAQQDRLSCD